MIKTRFSAFVRLFAFLLVPVCSANPLFAEILSPQLSKITQVAASADSAVVLNPGAEEPLLLLGSDVEKKLYLFRSSPKGVAKIGECPLLGHVWGATLYGSGADTKIVAAHGLGRGDLTPPLRIVSYPLSLLQSSPVKTFQTERAQVNSFKLIDNKILLTYFVSKYESETGFLTPVTNDDWSYEKVLAVRMGTSSDAFKDSTIIGRMYGDSQSQDGDLLLKKGSAEPITLPSYRGVSSLAFIPGATKDSPQIAIGDGWHSNYGQIAQARFSILSPIPGTTRYALDLIHIFKNAYAVNRIIALSNQATAPLLLVTDKELILAEPGKSWSFKPLYKQSRTDAVFDANLVRGDKINYEILISDGEISLNLLKLG
jgi:hypothetical protein